MNHFSTRMFISRYMASFSLSKCKFNCLEAIASSALSKHPVTAFRELIVWNRFNNFFSETENIPKFGPMIGFIDSNLFLIELIFK